MLCICIIHGYKDKNHHSQKRLRIIEFGSEFRATYQISCCSSPNYIICSNHTPLPRSTQTNVRITRQSALDNFWTSAPVLITLIAIVMDSYLNLFCSYDYIINDFYSLFKLWTKPSEILLSVCTSVSALQPNRNQNTTIHHVSSIYD